MFKQGTEDRKRFLKYCKIVSSKKAHREAGKRVHEAEMVMSRICLDNSRVLGFSSNRWESRTKSNKAEMATRKEMS